MVEELRKFDLEHYLSEVCQSLMPQLRPAGHVIQIDCPDIEMHTYPGALAQVITNLVMNSLVHGFDGRRDGQIRIGVTLNDDIVTLDYRDNGSGIPEEQMDKIFEPFFTTKRARGGTGLGMHISYNLVTQSLQGQISCVAADEGAFFQIRIPRSLKETSR
jgi:signal transduction histidine kinase